MALTLNVLFNYSFLDIYTAPYVFLAAVKKYIYKKNHLVIVVKGYLLLNRILWISLLESMKGSLCPDKLSFLYFSF